MGQRVSIWIVLLLLVAESTNASIYNPLSMNDYDSYLDPELEDTEETMDLSNGLEAQPRKYFISGFPRSMAIPFMGRAANIAPPEATTECAPSGKDNNNNNNNNNNKLTNPATEPANCEVATVLGIDAEGTDAMRRAEGEQVVAGDSVSPPPPPASANDAAPVATATAPQSSAASTSASLSASTSMAEPNAATIGPTPASSMEAAPTASSISATNSVSNPPASAGATVEGSSPGGSSATSSGSHKASDNSAGNNAAGTASNSVTNTAGNAANSLAINAPTNQASNSASSSASGFGDVGSTDNNSFNIDREAKSRELRNLVQHLYIAQARVQLEATEIKKAETVANAAQLTLEETANKVRVVTAALQNAQREVAAAAIRAQTAQLQLAAHDQLLFAARQDVDALSSQMVGLQAAEGVMAPKITFDVSEFLEKLKQPLLEAEKPTPVPRILPMPSLPPTRRSRSSSSSSRSRKEQRDDFQDLYYE